MIPAPLYFIAIYGAYAAPVVLVLIVWAVIRLAPYAFGRRV
jgi:hypothetical protein